MCGYQFPKSGEFCKRASRFWVQSLLSTHNQHCCPQHLPRIVNEIDQAARGHEITSPDRLGEVNPHYVRDGKAFRITSRESNYARVTVKPY